MNKLYKKFLLWLMGTHFYYWLLIRIVPYIRLSLYYTTIRGWKYHRGYKLLEPGDFILTLDRKKLTTFLVGGQFTHACQCIAKDGVWEVSEMTHENYTKSCFFDMCKEADRVVIMTCKDYDQDYINKVVIPTCKSLSNAVYDVEFDLGVKALYCSELVYQSDKEHRLQVNLEDLAGLGRQYISPTGLYLAKNGLVKWDSDQEVAPTGELADN